MLRSRARPGRARPGGCGWKARIMWWPTAMCCISASPIEGGRMSELWHYEDFAPGQSGEHGSYAVTADEIREFAQRWDPQPFHLDEDAGRARLMGALCASGWHVCAMMN